MSFVMNEKGTAYAPGHFLAHPEDVARETCTVKANHANVKTAANGGKYVPAGSVIPANDATAAGILYEDVDVSSGDMPGSIVTRGTVYEDKITPSVETAAKTALKGISFVTSTPAVTRPY